MAKVELNIVALGDFSSVQNQLKALQEQVAMLQKGLAGVGVSSTISKDLQSLNTQFKQTMLSTGQFTAATVAMQTETAKFGNELATGKLKLTDYYNIIKMRSSEAVTQFKALALEQTKLQNSIIMNDPTKTGILNVYTPTQINKVANATKIAANEANLYAIAVNKGTQALTNFGKNTQWAGRQLTVGMSVPLMIFGQQATQVFTDVNNELTRLAKVYGTGLTQPSQQALDAIKSQVTGLSRELAGSMGIAAKDTAAMAADLAATGKTGNDLLVATREAMRLSKLGELDTQSAMKATVSLQNVYKLSTQELSGAVDFLNAVENQTSTSLQDLVDGIPRVGPIVQQLGGSFKDTAVMMVAMKEAGVPAAQSANAIKSAIASLINPTVGAQKAFAAFHINLKGIAASTGGNPVEMIMQLQKALKGLAPLAQAQLIEKLFGKFQEARIQALITNLGAANSQTKTAFELMNANSKQLSSVAAGEMKTATDSTTGRYQRALQTFKADLIPVGQKVVEFATKLMNFGNAVANVFSKLPGPLQSIAGFLAIGTVLAGPIIMLTGLLANFAGFLIKGVFNIKQLVTGGKTIGQILTPEFIAAQNASKAFGTNIVSNVSEIELLSKSIADLTRNIEAMVSSMNVGTNISSLSSMVGGLAKSEIRTYEQMKLPGFASGGVVPGSGNQDTFPAMLTPGESIIPKGPSAKYAPLIQAMISGNLPHFSKGAKKVKRDASGQWVPTTDDDPLGEEVTSELMHLQPNEAANTSWLQKARAALHLQINSKGNPSLDQVNEVEPTFMVPGPGPVNQATRSDREGMLGSEIADNYRKFLAAGIKPIEYIAEVMRKLGIPLKDIEEQHVPKLEAAFESLIRKLETDSKNVRFGTNKDMAIHPGETNGGSFESEYYKGMEQPLSEIEAVGAKTGRRISLKEIYNRVLSTRGASAARRKDRKYNPEDKSNTGQPVVIQDDGSLASYDDSFMAEEFSGIHANMFTTGGSSPSLLKRLGLKQSKSSKPKLPKAVAYDIDETLAKTKGINQPGESWIDATANAEPIPEEVARLNKIREKGHKIIILTARTEHHQAQTEAWLKANDIPYDELVMREKGNNSPDGEFKKSALQRLQGRFRIKGLVDDKQENLNAAKSLGIKGMPALNGISDEAEKAGKSATKSYAKGIESEKAAVEKAASDVAHAATVAIASTQRSASKSKVTEQLGFDFGDGYDYGIQQSIPNATAAGEKLATGAITGVEEAGGPIGPLMENGKFTNNSGILGKIKGKVLNAEGKMNIQSRMAASTALMMGGSAIEGMLPKGSNLSNISGSISNMAGMGMMFGPWGAAAGAAIGLVTGSVGALMKAEKEHQATVKATFTASGDVISAYGGKMIEATQAVYNFNTASKQTIATLSKTAQDVAAINKAQSDNPLKEVGNLIKGFDTASSVIGTVKTFAAAQVAAGMDPKQVSQMVIDLLTYAGKTQYLNAALKEINAGTKDMTTATTTWLNKLKNTSDASTITATKYSDMSKSQKAYADGLLTTTNIISSQSTPIEVVLSKIKSLSDASNQSASSVNGLALALQNAGAAAGTVSQVTQWAAMGITNMGEVAMMLRLSAAGFTNLNSKNAADLTKAVTTDIVKMVEDQSAASIKSAQERYDSEVKKYNAAVAAQKAAAAAAITKAKQAEIDALGKSGAAQYDSDKKLLKVKEAQLNTLKLQTAELQKQQQYQMTQQDLDSQMKLAEVSGDYLKAAGLQQQKNYTASQFGSDKQQTALQSEIDMLKSSIADSELKISSHQSSTSTGSPVDNSGVVMAKAALDIAKQSGNVKNMVIDINKYLSDSGLTGFKAVIDGKGAIHVIVDSGKLSITGTSDNIPGSISAPVNASQAESYATLHKNFGAPVYDKSTGALSTYTGGTNEGVNVATTVAHDLGFKKDTYFKWFNPKTLTYDYYFYSAKKDDAIRLDPNTPGLPTKANGGLISNYAAGSFGGVKGPGTGTSDSILARVSNGEYVIKADAVAHYGLGFFDSINAKKFGASIPNSSPRFSAVSGQDINANSTSTVYNINMNVNSNASDPKAVADYVMSQLTVATAKKNVTNIIGRN